MKKLLLITLIITCSNIIAQNYRTIKSDAEYYFLCNTCNYKDINGIKIDSVLLNANDTILLNFKTMRNPIFQDTCGNPYGASWLGNKIILKSNGYNYFFNKYNDTIIINTQAKINDSWRLYQYPNNNYLEATIISIDTTLFLGIADSVKTIELQLKDSSGNNLSNSLNNSTFKLSKNYGLIKMPDFYEFPYDSIPDVTSVSNEYIQNYFPEYYLVGKTNPDIGIVNIKAENIFDYNIGDEFHTERIYTIIGPGTKYIIHTINKVIAKYRSENNDTLIYSIERCGRQESWENSNSHIFSYFNDTIQKAYIWSNNLYSHLNFMPNETYSIFIEYDYCDLKITDDYNNRLVKWNPPIVSYSSSIDTCYNFGSLIPGATIYYYINGCGEYYTGSYDDFFGEYDHLSLKYFKKGSEYWGTPFVCSTLLDNSVIQLQNPRVKLYPNPLENISYLEILDLNENILDIDIFNSSGRKIMSTKTLNKNKITLEKSKMSVGLHFYTITTQSGKQFTGKFIVN